MSRTEDGKTLVYPGLLDPRWLQILFLLSFDVYALASPGFSRRPAQWFAGMAACLVLDAGFNYGARRLLLAPVSGLISSLGLLLLCDSPFVWPYAAVGTLSILSKQAIRADGRHIFNPLNFGIVVGLLFFSGEMTVVAGRWGGGLPGLGLVAALGVVVVWRAKRLDLAVAYGLSFLAGCYVRSLATGASMGVLTAPMTGAAFMLFTFFMITDPMTTPETVGGRLLFGVALGALDNFLRWRQVSFSPFYALFALSAFVPLWRRAFAAGARETVWRPKTVRVGGLLLLLALGFASAARAEDCAERFAPARLAADLRGGAYDAVQRNRIAAEAGPDAMKYFSYTAFLKGDRAACGVLKPLHSKDHNEDRLCETSYLELVYVEALVRHRVRDRDKACADDVQFHEGAARKNAEEKCAYRGRRLDALGPHPTVAQIAAGCADVTRGADRKQRDKCTPYSRAFFGDDGGCGDAGADVADAGQARSDVVQCRSFAAYARARKAGKLEVCGGLELCEVLMRRPEAALKRRAALVAEALCPVKAELEIGGKHP